MAKQKAMLTPRAHTTPPRNRTIDFLPRGEKQKQLVHEIEENPIVFATGCAGGGKTFVCVAMAVKALLNREIETIIVTRPIVEAGESLGFLPGDIREKTDPYNAPILEALRRFLGSDLCERLIEESKIRLIPLAYTRGLTYENAWMILDEAQNSSAGQMKMFLTRMGLNSRITVTGDESQIDLPCDVVSGLTDALKVLKDVQNVGHVHFTENDVQRHPMVGHIVSAYEKALKRRKTPPVTRLAGGDGILESQMGALPKSGLNNFPERFSRSATTESMSEDWIA